MNQYAMIVLLPSNMVEAFKDDLAAVCPGVKFYNALTSDIKCREEALAVMIPGDDAYKTAVYDLLASSGYKLSLPIPITTTKQETDKVCSFRFPFRDARPDVNLLNMWEFCDQAKAKQSAAVPDILRYAIYVDEDCQVVNFQACYRLEDDFQVWQKAITDFCFALTRESGRRLHISFEHCRLYANDRKA